MAACILYIYTQYMYIYIYTCSTVCLGLCMVKPRIPDSWLEVMTEFHKEVQANVSWARTHAEGMDIM